MTEQEGTATALFPSSSVLDIDRKEYASMADAHKTAKNAALTVLIRRLHAECTRPNLPFGGSTTPVEMTAYLKTCCQCVERWLVEKANTFHPFIWLCRLRCMPAPVFGDDPLTQSAVADLSEIFSGMSKCQPGSGNLNFDSLPKDQKLLNAALELVEGAKLYYNIQNLIAWLSRGSRLYFRASNDVLPALDRTPVEIRSEAIFQKRLMRAFTIGAPHSMPVTCAGNPLGQTTVDFEREDIPDSIFMVRKMWPPQLVHLETVVVDGQRTKIAVGGRYLVDPISLARLRELNDRDEMKEAHGWWNPWAPDLILLLRVGTLIAFENQKSMLFPQGMAIFQESELMKAWDKTIADGAKGIEELLPGAGTSHNAKDLVRSLEKMSGSVSPIMPGWPIRRYKKWFILDLYAASRMLNQALEFSRSITGAAGRIRGHMFEPEVQAVIDQSSWKPSAELGALLGKDLFRANGTRITDVDAIGEHGSTLLFVSAKAFVLSSRYHSGDFSAYRSLMDDLKDAHKKLEKVVSELPGSVTFDFSKYEKIIATVCTYTPIWMPIGPLTEEVAPGLPAVTSINELALFCAQSQTS